MAALPHPPLGTISGPYCSTKSYDIFYRFSSYSEPCSIYRAGTMKCGTPYYCLFLIIICIIIIFCFCILGGPHYNHVMSLLIFLFIPFSFPISYPLLTFPFFTSLHFHSFLFFLFFSFLRFSKLSEGIPNTMTLNSHSIKCTGTFSPFPPYLLYLLFYYLPFLFQYWLHFIVYWNIFNFVSCWSHVVRMSYGSRFILHWFVFL